jgi:hypothetical protein
MAARNTSSAEEMTESFFGAARRPIRTQGMCRGHSAPARRAHKASLICLCAHSTIPFDWGW